MFTSESELIKKNIISNDYYLITQKILKNIDNDDNDKVKNNEKNNESKYNDIILDEENDKNNIKNNKGSKKNEKKQKNEDNKIIYNLNYEQKEKIENFI